MDNNEVAKNLAELAEAINAEHRAFLGTVRKAVEQGIRVGELLDQAKEQCPHGTWLPWLEENFEGSVRTAQEYIRLYRYRDDIRAKTRDFAYLSISGALRDLASPRGEPATFEVDYKPEDAAPEHAARPTKYNVKVMRPKPATPPPLKVRVGHRMTEPDKQAAEPDAVMEYVSRVIALVENDERIDRSNVALIGRLKWLRHLLNEVDL
jgi:hypothetical protein